MEYSKKRKDESRAALKFALAEAEGKYKTASLENELRIQEMNRSHAEQCEQLCREVIQANRETVRLRKQNAELTNSSVLSTEIYDDRAQQGDSSLTGGGYSLQSPPSSNRSTKKSPHRRSGIILLMAVILLFVGLGQPGYLAKKVMRLPSVWKDLEKTTFELLRPLVSILFMQPKSNLEIGLSKRKISGRVIVGPRKRKASVRVGMTPMSKARMLGVQQTPIDNGRSSQSVNISPKNRSVADKIFSPFAGLKSCIRRLFRFLKEIIQVLVGKNAK